MHTIVTCQSEDARNLPDCLIKTIPPFAKGYSPEARTGGIKEDLLFRGALFISILVYSGYLRTASLTKCDNFNIR